MNLRSIRTGLLTALTLTAVLASAGAASADSLVVDDATSDVWEDVYDQETQTQNYVESGSVLNVDVASTDVRHTAKKILITFTYAELKSKQVHFMTRTRLRFDDGPKVVAGVNAMDVWKGRAELAKDRSGEPISCDGLSRAIDYDLNTVELSIPRSCVGNPAWVELNSINNGYEDVDGTSHYYIDNVLRTGHSYDGWTDKVNKG